MLWAKKTFNLIRVEFPEDAGAFTDKSELVARRRLLRPRLRGATREDGTLELPGDRIGIVRDVLRHGKSVAAPASV